ncbi:MAG: hypothetical protein U0800_17425 [Isosphaeraceae bacterium]
MATRPRISKRRPAEGRRVQGPAEGRSAEGRRVQGPAEGRSAEGRRVQGPAEGRPAKGDQQKGDASKDQQKGDASKDQQKGDQQKGDQQKGDASKDQQKGDQQKGDQQKGSTKSKNGGERNGDLPKGEDTSTPSPRAREGAPDRPSDVNPGDEQRKGDFARRVRDLLKNEDTAKQLEEETGMSRSDLEQFVDRFQKKEQAAGREASTLEANPTEDPDYQGGAQFPGMKQGSSFGQRAARGGGNMPQESAGGNVQGARSVAPSRVKSRYEAYLKSMSKSASSTPDSASRPPAAPAPSQPKR